MTDRHLVVGYLMTRTVRVGEIAAVVTKVAEVVAAVMVRNFHGPSRPVGTLILYVLVVSGVVAETVCQAPSER